MSKLSIFSDPEGAVKDPKRWAKKVEPPEPQSSTPPSLPEVSQYPNSPAQMGPFNYERPLNDAWVKWNASREKADQQASQGSLAGALRQFYLSQTEPNKHPQGGMNMSEGDLTNLGLSLAPLLAYPPLLLANSARGAAISGLASEVTPYALGHHDLTDVAEGTLISGGAQKLLNKGLSKLGAIPEANSVDNFLRSKDKDILRTGRNIARVIPGTDPRIAAIKELETLGVPGVENSVAVSPRGWAGPVSSGTDGNVQTPLSSRLVKASQDFHTHLNDGPVSGLHPADANISPREATTVLHADPEGKLTGEYETLRNPASHVQDAPAWEGVTPSKFREFMNSTGGYSTNVPGKFLDEPYTNLSPTPELFQVIKPKWGNWLEPEIANAVRGLKRRGTVPGRNQGEVEATPQFVADLREVVQNMRDIGNERRADILEEAVPGAERNVQLNEWLDGPFSSYIKNDLGATTDPVRIRADRVAQNALVAKNKAEKQIYKAEQRLAMMREKGPDKPLPPDVWAQVLERTQRTVDTMKEEAEAAYETSMARALPQEQGAYGNLDFAPGAGMRFKREAFGMPKQEVASSIPGSLWERAADQQISPRTAGEIRDKSGWIADGLGRELAANPWVMKVPAETPVYDIYSGAPSQLGLNHVVDEMKNALNPNSGLPAHLQITPDILKTFGIEKAVDHVADINTYRAALKAQTSEKLGNAMPAVREYTENNPKGLRWVELKAGDAPSVDWVESGAPGVFRHTNGTVLGRQNAISHSLEQQLKYEGDTMQHCVGGYCPDVLEGRSRIFSLRDKKGEPHVTIEVAPAQLSRAEQQAYAELEADGIPREEWGQFLAPELKAKFEAGSPSKIVQIKGKQNRKPNDEYLPFVQDFVRNNPLGGKWGEVRDLQNSGLQKVGDEYMTLDEMHAVLGRRLPDGRPQWDQRMQDAVEAQQRVIDDADPNRFASGGSVRKNPAEVRSVTDLHDIIALLETA